MRGCWKKEGGWRPAKSIYINRTNPPQPLPAIAPPTIALRLVALCPAFKHRFLSPNQAKLYSCPLHPRLKNSLLGNAANAADMDQGRPESIDHLIKHHDHKPKPLPPPSHPHSPFTSTGAPYLEVYLEVHVLHHSDARPA